MKADLRMVGFVVGIVLLFIAGMMLLPLGVSLYYLDGDSVAISWSMLITALFGGGLVLMRRRDREINIRDGFLVVTFGWLAMALVGSMPYYLSGAIPSFSDCFFESISGFTTTGASILGGELPVESLPHGVLFWRSLTHWIGGMGIILLSLAILPMLGIGGMQLYRAEVAGPTKDKLTPRIRDTAKILWFVYLGLTVAETVLLMAGGMNLFDATCHTFGTLATGGFSTRSDSIGAFHSRYIEYVIIVFMFVGATNFALHYRVIVGRSVSAYWQSREFRLFVGVITLYTTLMVISNFHRGSGYGFEENLRLSLFQVVSIATTTGFGTVDYELWGWFAQLLLIFAMLVGGMAGSTSGAMKMLRFKILLEHVRLELRRLIHPQAVLPMQIGGRVIEQETIRGVLTFILAYILTLAISSALLTAMGIDLVTAFGASATTLGGTGPGFGAVGPADNYRWLPTAGKWVLCGTMLLGRLEIFTVLVLFSRHFWRK